MYIRSQRRRNGPTTLRRAIAGLLALVVGGVLFVSAGTATRTLAGTTQLFAWETLTSSPLTRAEAQGAAVGGKLYLFGGFYNGQLDTTVRSDLFDSATNKWTRIADMPEPLTHAAQVVDGTTIYLIGGYVGKHPGPATAHVWIYNTLTNSWSAGPNLPEPRAGGAAAILAGEIHYVGGATRTAGTTDDTDHADHWVLKLNGGTSWVNATPLPLARNHLGGAALGGKLYAIGGQFGHSEATTNQSRVDVYDPATKTWATAAPMPTARGHITSSTIVWNGRILVAGGSVNGGSNGNPTAVVELYDPQIDVWVKLPSLPSGRKTPVADIIGDALYVSTGNSSAPTTSTWRAVLPERWESGATMPVALGEVAVGRVGGKLYLVGEGSSATLSYDLGKNTWSGATALRARPFPGNHHAAEVVNGKLYLFGGLGSSSSGKLQIYDPAANSWSQGADMPFAAGSSASALIGGEVYVAGGITGRLTTSRMAKYNPASNSWTELAPMPQGRNHAASATDGSKLYVFGGRGPGSGDDNTVANGFDTVQVYDPASNTWASSDTGAVAPLPQARGGTGKAVFLNGLFYVIGGETASGAGAVTGNVYDRVDVYDPVRNTWQTGTPMPTARHGIFPIVVAGRIYVAGGGVQAGFSSSNKLEIYTPAQPSGAQPPATSTPTRTATSVPGATSTATATRTATATPAPAGQPIRINAGGSAQTVGGVSWLACSAVSTCGGYVTGGARYSESDTVSGVQPPANNTIYQSEWTGGTASGLQPGQTAFTFNVPVGNGSYLVRLHFTELNKNGPNLRLFDVTLEGALVLDDFDIYVAAGGIDKALVREFPVTVADDNATLAFITVKENAKISAIEIIPVSTGTPTGMPAATATATATSSPVPTTATRTSTPAATATSTGASAATATRTAAPATATSTATANGPSVASLSLMNAASEQPVAGLDPFVDGATINLATLPSRQLNVRANTSPATVGSVRFGYDGTATYRMENVVPYALVGDTNGNFNAWTPAVGEHTITVTAYSATNGSGTASTPVVVHFTVIDQPATP